MKTVDRIETIAKIKRRSGYDVHSGLTIDGRDMPAFFLGEIRIGWKWGFL